METPVTSKVSRKRQRACGFTLVEVLVASGAATLVILAALAFLVMHVRDYGNQHLIRETQQEVAFGFDSLVRDLRMAGYGLNVPAADLPLWLNCVGGLTTNPLILAGAGVGGSDAVRLAGAFGQTRATLATSAVRGSSLLTLEPGQARQFGQPRGRVVCVGGVEAARVVSFSSNFLTVSTHPTRQRALSRDYAPGTPVELVEALTYILRVDTNNVEDDRPFLARVRQCETNQNVMDQMVAAGIEELHLSADGYGVEVEIAGSTASPLRGRIGPGASDEHRLVRTRTFVLPRNSPAVLRGQ